MMSERLTREREQEILARLAQGEPFPNRRDVLTLLAEIDALRGEVEASKAQLHETVASTHEAMEQVKKERDEALSSVLAWQYREEAQTKYLNDWAAFVNAAMEEVRGEHFAILRERDGAQAACMTNLMAADSWRSMCKKVEEMLERSEDECNELRRALEASNADGR